MRARLAILFVAGAACHRTAAGSSAPDAAVPVVGAAPPLLDADLPVAAPPPERVLPDVTTEWCLPPWKGLDDATCYFVPDSDAGAHPTELLIYLAGIVPPGGVSKPKEHVEGVVSRSAQRAGVVALLPRGRK